MLQTSLYLVSRNFNEKHPHISGFFIPPSLDPEIMSFFGSEKFPFILHSLCYPFKICVKYTPVKPTHSKAKLEFGENVCQQ